jgi:hypothetical protein
MGGRYRSQGPHLSYNSSSDTYLVYYPSLYKFYKYNITPCPKKIGKKNCLRVVKNLSSGTVFRFCDDAFFQTRNDRVCFAFRDCLI